MQGSCQLPCFKSYYHCYSWIVRGELELRKKPHIQIYLYRMGNENNDQIQIVIFLFLKGKTAIGSGITKI